MSRLARLARLLLPPALLLGALAPLRVAAADEAAPATSARLRASGDLEVVGRTPP
ncbi:MAG: hypothetical protein H6942_00690 [Candidatus Accumulibacter sp.]|uniref:hypothetical protein n=1 Tax=Accumulibacter sp. TaxID=2053492 RepID=UPI0019DD55FC|nr:hypothetical protein [Accumulibacter sp.]MBE2257290.1 hypothetical protein [Paracoccaceae bacterium]MCB1940487.1 hypothetical protein [Accumulibacter sp.]MCP5247055.1 hypothetical protein [Accumulibacter sp.]